jgi:hypothetical protein
MTMTVLAWILFYFIVCVFLIRLAVKHDKEQLSTLQIALALGFKVLLGCAYGYIFLVKYDGDDTWLIHEFSLEQQDLLINDPLRFFSEMNPFTAFNRYDDLYSNSYYYLSDLEAWLLAKPFAFLNLLSGGNYYINIVFFNAFTFWGHYWIFQLVRRRFTVQVQPLFICIFFIPPVVFWLSGLRADGYLLLFIALLLLQFDKALVKATVKNILFVLIASLGILILRSGLMILLAPALFSWWLAAKYPVKPLRAYFSVYAICLAVFLAGMMVFPGKNPGSAIVSRQRAFFELEGNTKFKLDSLSADAGSFIRIFPQAANNTFLRPYPWEAKGALQYAAVLEVMLFLLLIGLFCYRRNPAWKEMFKHPVMLTLLCFAFSLYILTGYTVPYPGAIVRYKIIGELFFFVALCCGINWPLVMQKHIKK